MEIFKMNPVFKEYLWGGDKLKSIYEKDTPFEITAESWEIASHKNGETTVSGGVDDGKTISELISIYKEKLLGDKIYAGEGTKFPLLVKLIDARDNLSVQVHPDDKYANDNENGEYGKTEMWYVMDAEEGAGIIYGFKQDITKEDFKNSILDNTLLEKTNFVECKKGDYFFIPSGMLHAIGKGLLIAEIQQNSDTTYRVYDYDRKDKKGNARELHIEKAIDVTNIKASETGNMKESGTIVDCPYFTTEKIIINGTNEITVSKQRFEIIIICEGELLINDTLYKKGDSMLVPAYAEKLFMVGEAVILRSYIENR